MRLTGKIAIVTGAASGIGAAVAARFESAGAVVVATDLTTLDNPAACQMDVSVESDWRGLIERVLTRHGKIHILVNAAGVSLAGDTIETCSPETLMRTLAVNLDGTFLGCRHVIAPMRKQGDGSIINFGSVLGKVGDGASAAYTTSKGGVGMLTKSAALYLAKTAPGVRCNQISPGYIATPMVEQWLASLPNGQARLDQLIEAHPVRRLGRPEEVAAAALFLAADESRAVTGADFLIDGGYTAQ
ncbi:SDR family oxidoreductase [Mesorhizobium qingshengii]|uniref:NAD(P)-dependent dehydrogenase, short-chain alcohol dehydrogenase family n=1 Tax=Mesorhizobium qingshengii TaxID=1165689 RepID=A0A1G5ZW52_9HYPH|nr:SDR family oxidoreductase [Mesorhizobium qingshengii]SDA98706.1 NAD(P)-dependent dehydrogenase, short-chain alcohol dehydrogenase family [Mesorhizobium qingshengii]